MDGQSKVEPMMTLPSFTIGGYAADPPGTPPEMVTDYIHAVIEDDCTFCPFMSSSACRGRADHQERKIGAQRRRPCRYQFSFSQNRAPRLEYLNEGPLPVDQSVADQSA